MSLYGGSVRKLCGLELSVIGKSKALEIYEQTPHS